MDHDDVINNNNKSLQFYIVTGGATNALLDSTEILKKGQGNAWQTVASLPSRTQYISGVSLANGHFMVSGEDSDA